MWNLKYKANELIMKQTHRCREETKSCQRGGMDWEFGFSRCKLVHTEWINNEVLPYSTGNSIRHPVINHNGKEYEKECARMYN